MWSFLSHDKDFGFDFKGTWKQLKDLSTGVT